MPRETPTSTPRPLGCEEWIAMLTDAVDGVLPSSDSVAFFAHKEECASCAQLLEEARRGAEWLRFLAPEPEAPAGLAERILAQTTGQPVLVPKTGGGIPVLAPAGPGLPQAQPWIPSARVLRFGSSLNVFYRHPAESRLLMTVAMAFFSIALTLNLVGVRLREFRLHDLKPTVLAMNISRGYYSASAQVMRYYENLRFVYELESRVNELRRSASTAPQETTPAPKPSTGVTAQPSQTPPKAQTPGGGAAVRNRPASAPAVPSQTQSSPVAPSGFEAEPATIIPVTLDQPRPSRKGSGAAAQAPHSNTRDQAERSLA